MSRTDVHRCRIALLPSWTILYMSDWRGHDVQTCAPIVRNTKQLVIHHMFSLELCIVEMECTTGGLVSDFMLVGGGNRIRWIPCGQDIPEPMDGIYWI